MSDKGGFRFNIRSVLSLFFLLAIAFAYLRTPSAGMLDEGWMEWELSWHYALLAIASSLTSLKLISQANDLKRLKDKLESRPVGFAIQYGVVWRWLAALGLVVCVGTQLLIAHRAFDPQEWNEGYWLDPVFPTQMWRLLVITVLIAWRPVTESTHANSLWKTLTRLSGVILAIILVFVLVSEYFVTALEFQTETETREVMGPSRYYRPRFPSDPATRAIAFFTCSCGAIASYLVGAALTVSLIKYQTLAHRWLSKKAVIAYLLLTISALCSLWYKNVGLPGAFPDSAYAVFQGDWYNYLSAIALLAVVALLPAWELSTRIQGSPPVVLDKAKSRKAWRDSGLLGVLYVVLSLLFMERRLFPFIDIVGTVIPSPPFPINIITFVFQYLCYDIEAFFMVGIFLEGARMCWRSWMRIKPVMAMRTLDRSSFLMNWICIYLILLLGVPVFATSIFSFWLGLWCYW